MSIERSNPTVGMSPAEEASYWFVRRDGRELTGEEAAAFDHWIGASPANRRAIEQMTAAWSLFDGVEDNAAIAPQRAHARAALNRRGIGWRASAGGLVAAALVVGFLSATPIWRSTGFGDGVSSPAVTAQASRYVTRKGEMKEVALADGSKVTLNTGSEIRVDMTTGLRSIRLVRGQALFEVAHDAGRPFVVTAADNRVTALGTVFEVRLDPNRMEVVLVRGRVAVDPTGEGGASRSVLEPGEAIVVAQGVARRVTSVDVNAKLRWREGFVEFADKPLGQAIEEINRYSDRALVLQDEGLAAERISGVFRTGDPDRFAAIVSELVPIDSHIQGGSIVLTRRAQSGRPDVVK